MLIENTFLPVSLCPNLSWEMLETESLYSILSKKYGLKIAKAIETYEAVVMTKEESQAARMQSRRPGVSHKARHMGRSRENGRSTPNPSQPARDQSLR